MTAPQALAPPRPDGLLALVQWLSPAFPVGGFAYSHGMETLIAAGALPEATSVRRWIGDVLTFGAGRSDAILLAHALRPEADHDALADLARALAPTAERLRETEELGAALARATGPLTNVFVGPLPYPVVLGRAAATLGLPPPMVIALWLQAFAASLVSVAVRFVPLGQSEGQAILASFAPLILEIANAAATAPLSAIATATPGADIASARHETLAVRMFRT